MRGWFQRLFYVFFFLQPDSDFQDTTEDKVGEKSQLKLNSKIFAKLHKEIQILNHLHNRVALRRIHLHWMEKWVGGANRTATTIGWIEQLCVDLKDPVPVPVRPLQL